MRVGAPVVAVAWVSPLTNVPMVLAAKVPGWVDRSLACRRAGDGPTVSVRRVDDDGSA